MFDTMTLSIFLPHQLILKEESIMKITFETLTGSYGIYPNRLDFVSALIPSILTYEIDAVEFYVAVDEGILIKTNNLVTLSTRNAFPSPDLGQLQILVEEIYLKQSEREERVKRVMSKLESEFMKRYLEIRHGQKR